MIANVPWHIRGEKTAQALESDLTSLERKLDELLASAEASAPAVTEKEAGADGKDHGGGS